VNNFTREFYNFITSIIYHDAILVLI